MAIRIIKNEKLWMEDEAILQLETFSKLKGVIDVVGLPDLHQGKTPVGATFKTKDMIYPFLIGNDIGCGMSLFDTDIKLKKFNISKVLKKLTGTSIYGKYSIGGGNHFAEFQSIDKIYHKQYAEEFNLDKKHVYLLVHSGSRNMGDRIYREYASKEGLEYNTNDFNEYMKKHDEAVKFAYENRMNVADSVLNILEMKYINQLIVNCNHNIIELHDGYYYHHKGSISSFNKYAIIAGSRGDYSYIVRCIPVEDTLYSVSHGAGRKWPRHLCKGRLETKYNKEQIKTSQLGSVVITDKKELLYEEASEAYKNIEEVIDVLLDYECIEIIARLRPMVTYKC